MKGNMYLHVVVFLLGDLLERTFSFLDRLELVRMSAVSRLWRQVSETDYMWKRMLEKRLKLGLVGAQPALKGHLKEIYHKIKRCVFSFFL